MLHGSLFSWCPPLAGGVSCGTWTRSSSTPTVPFAVALVGRVHSEHFFLGAIYGALSDAGLDFE
eukprot:12613711-Alexandrium_andersonii.AAC.1